MKECVNAPRFAVRKRSEVTTRSVEEFEIRQIKLTELGNKKHVANLAKLTNLANLKPRRH